MNANVLAIRNLLEDLRRPFAGPARCTVCGIVCRDVAQCRLCNTNAHKACFMRALGLEDGVADDARCTSLLNAALAALPDVDLEVADVASALSKFEPVDVALRSLSIVECCFGCSKLIDAMADIEI